MRIAQAAIAVDCPVFPENPRASQIWSMPPGVKLAKRDSYLPRKVDVCQYGSPWKKATSTA
eukprot:9007586-Pyramimonas_sp.AAC.1